MVVVIAASGPKTVSSKEEAAKTKQIAAEVWYYSKSYSVCRKDMKSTLRSGKACKAKYCAGSAGGMSEWRTQR